jgi:hypothetical protein
MSKRDGSNDLSTNNFKFACAELIVHVACLLSSVLIHGSVPEDFLKGTTIPLWKSKNVTNSDNYRGITLSSVWSYF